MTKSKFVQLFERDHGRCVYCGLDLKRDFDTFLLSTEDHLVPGSKGSYARDLKNLILSCTVCNRFKADFTPNPPIDPAKDKKKYIRALRAHIMKRRAEHLSEYTQVTHPTQPDYH